MIFLHDIDWKIRMNNRHMSLMLLATLKIVSCLKNYSYHNHDMSSPITPGTCFEWVWISTTIGVWHIYWMNYKLQVPKWILIKSYEISVKHCQMKVKVYDYSSIHWQFLKQTLHYIIPLFHEFAVWDWNDVLVLLCTAWLCHLISQINMSVH